MLGFPLPLLSATFAALAGNVSNKPIDKGYMKIEALCNRFILKKVHRAELNNVPKHLRREFHNA